MVDVCNQPGWGVLKMLGDHPHGLNPGDLEAEMQHLHHENELMARMLGNNLRMVVIEEETGIPTKSNGVSHVLAANSQGGGGGLRACQNKRNPSQ